MQGGHTLVLSMGFVEGMRDVYSDSVAQLRPMGVKRVQTSLRSYGHVWQHVEMAYRCLTAGADANGTATPVQVLMPAVYSGGRRPEAAFAELELLLNGRDLSVRRLEDVHICMPAQQCCMNDASTLMTQSLRARGITLGDGQGGARAAQLRIPFNTPPFLLLPQLAPPPTWRLALRSTVWRNLGVEAAQADIVLFSLSGKLPRNGRLIQQEKKVTKRLRAFFAARSPQLRFVAQQLDQLSYAEELRLVRRARVFISLFGSALHNCRFLPPEALVVEIHGALKNDIGVSDALLYGRLCAVEMGLRWVGWAANGSAPEALLRKSRDARTSSAYFIATVAVPQLLGILDAAMRGEWQRAMAQYAMATTAGEPADTASFISMSLQRLRQLPQYAHPQ